jgi:hypothetical protein
MKILVIAHPDDPLTYMIANAFHQSFLSLGCVSSLLSQYESGHDVCLVMYAHDWYNFPKDNTYKIAYNWECLQNSMWRNRVHRALGQFNCIFEMSPENLKIDLPIKRLYCPIGYHPTFEMPYVVGPKQNIALIGYVSQKSHRHQVIENIERELGSKVWCIRTKDHWANANNKQLNQVIFNTLVQLNIHRNPKYKMFESIRVIAQLISNKCFVISEPSYDSLLVNGQHYIETNDIVNTIRHYLKRPEECDQIAQQGYRFVRGQCKLETHVERCLRQL